MVHFTTDVLHDLTVQYAAPDDRAVTDSIARLAPHDSTNVQAGLDLGVRLADKMRQERPEALNYIVLMSDGVANVDATDPFAILEATSAQSGANPLRIITVGVGIENYNDHLLEQLAQHGNGWYRYLFDVEQARSTFRRENWLALTSPVADQTRAQVVWNPEAVRAWRIVGYENRVTSAASFTQDRQEFAEVYSGAATTVFYELELHDDFRQKGGLGQVELRWVEPESRRAWSQSSDLVSSGAVVRPHEDPLLRFGAVVALTADRYSALGDSPESYRGYAQDLWSLRDRDGGSTGRPGPPGRVQGLRIRVGKTAHERSVRFGGRLGVQPVGVTPSAWSWSATPDGNHAYCTVLHSRHPADRRRLPVQTTALLALMLALVACGETRPTPAAPYLTEENRGPVFATG